MTGGSPHQWRPGSGDYDSLKKEAGANCPSATPRVTAVSSDSGVNGFTTWPSMPAPG
jgi:hypothetical protein